MERVVKQRVDVSPLTRKIVEIIREAMASRQMMQNQLADATGISTATINRILKNARVIDINELDAICEALNIEAWAVLREAQHPNWRYALAADQQDLTAEEEQRIMEQEP